MNMIEFLEILKEEELKAKFLQIIFILEQSSKKYYKMTKEKVNVWLIDYILFTFLI